MIRGGYQNNRISNTIALRIHGADLLRDPNTFSTMDPYTIIRLGGDEKMTKVDNNAGKKPSWNQNFEFTDSGRENECIIFVVMDKSTITKDRVVGDTILYIDDLRGRGNTFRTLQLMYKGSFAGSIEIDISVPDVPGKQQWPPGGNDNFPEQFQQQHPNVSKGFAAMKGVQAIRRAFPNIPQNTYYQPQNNYMNHHFDPRGPQPQFQQPPQYQPQGYFHQGAQQNEFQPPPGFGGFEESPLPQVSPRTPNEGIQMNRQMAETLLRMGLVSPFIAQMQQNQNQNGKQENMNYPSPEKGTDEWSGN